MKIVSVQSHVLQTDMPEELGYSQQFYSKRTAHLVEVRTDEGLVGWGECFGPGNVALANKVIVETVLQPMVLGMNPLGREVIWHKVYNLLRDHGQKGMPLQAISGLDIALWDLSGKALGAPIWQLIGGRYRDSVRAYGYGMMLRRETCNDLVSRFADEAAAIKDAGFAGAKMKVGLGVAEDIRLCRSVRDALGDGYPMMVDANHCYTTSDAFEVGRALDEMGVYWFEEPVAPEDLEGYAALRRGLRTNVSGGEAEFTRWGWRRLLDSGGLDIAQPEVCGLGGISEYLKVRTLCETAFTPIVNHVWGSAISVTTNLHLLASMAPMPGGEFPREPWLENDTTENIFRDGLLETPLDLMAQVKETGSVRVPDGPGLGVEPDLDFIRHYRVG